MQDSIVTEGDPVLRAKAKPLSKEDIAAPATKRLIARMKKLLKAEEHGVGLAAPQAGESVRLFIVSGRALMDEAKHEHAKEARAKPAKKDSGVEAPVPPDMVFINPSLVRSSRAMREMAEGCLSVPGRYGTVMRREKATVKALDEHGKPFTYHGSGLVAHVFQHELDHLDGILYTDKAVKVEDESERGALRKRYSPGEPAHAE